ncbi:MAG: HD domain-containing protein [Bacteroidetes bacterium]|nr:HD domain-containing protein [Bacteroidota bacterium]
MKNTEVQEPLPLDQAFVTTRCKEAVESDVFRLVSEQANELGYPAYVIGGYVRDAILERGNMDIDIVCVGNGIELAQRVAKKLKGSPTVSIFKKFGTAMISANELQYEFVGARKESYAPDSRKPSVTEGSLEDDFARRDFTINALAISLNPKDYGTLLDPFDGLSDMAKGVIKTPKNPASTFSDDPLRMMRAIRFAAQLDYKIEAETLQGITDSKDRIGIVSQERITEELNKIIQSPIPSVGFGLLFDTKLLQIIFSEMAALQGVEIRNNQAHKDNFYHTLKVLDNVAATSDDLWLRWAAVLHDIAKPRTKKFDDEHGWTFHGHDAIGARMTYQLFKKFKLPLNEKMKFVQKLVAMHLRPISAAKDGVTDSGIRRLLFEAGEDIDSLMKLCRADITSKNDARVKRYLSNFDKVVERMEKVEESDKLRNWQPPVTGEMIMDTFNVGPSRKIGIIKNLIKDSILDGIIPNNKKAAIKLMLEKGIELGLKPKKPKP